METDATDDSLYQGAAGLLESSGLVSAGGVGQEDAVFGGVDGDVVG